MSMIGIKMQLFLKKIPLFFIACYFFTTLIINLYLGGNSKQNFLPILLLSTVFIFISVSDERFLRKFSKTFLITMTDAFLLINIIIFITGKFNSQNLFFKTIDGKFDINLKLILIVCTTILLCVKLYFRNKNLQFWSFLFTLIFFLSSIFLIPNLYPNPFIDLYIILKQSILDLYHGLNPYERVFPDIYKGIYDYAYQKQEIKLVYWPMNLYLIYPFQILFGDLRYAYIFSLCISCVILYFGCGKNKTILYTSTILLLSNVYTLNMIKYAWIDTLAFPFFALYFIFFDKKKYFLASLVLGILMSLKLYFIVLLPLSFIFFFNIEKNIKKGLLFVFFSVSIFLICFLPFLLTDQKAIFYTLEYFSKSHPRYDSLSVSGYIYQFGSNLDLIFSTISIILILFIFFWIYKKKETSTLSQIRYLCIMLFVLFLFAKQAFGNYYYNLIFLSIIYVCLLINSDITTDKKVFKISNKI